MERKHIDFVSSIVMLALSVYVIVESMDFYSILSQRMGTPFTQSPGFFTMIIGVVLLACSVLLLVRSVRGGAFAENIQKIKEGSTNFLKSPVALRSLIGCSWMGIYIFVLLPYLGFVIGSLIFLIVMMTFVEAPSFKGADTKMIALSVVKYAVISGIAVGATSGLFQIIFRVPLP